MEAFNAAEFLVHRHLGAATCDKTALVGSQDRTYRELSGDVARVAGGLRSLGLRGDDRLLLVMVDDVQMATTLLAAFHAGFVAVPVSTMLKGHELTAITRDSGARAVVASPEFLASVIPAVDASPEVAHLLVAGGADVSAVRSVRAGLTVSCWTDLLEGAAEDPAPTEPDSWALWLYTSGTTGSPKAAMHRHASIRHVYETFGRQILGVHGGDRCLSVAKMFFAYGIGNSLFFPLAASGAAILEPLRPTPRTMGARIRAASPTLFFAVPTFYSSLLASDLADNVFSTVRLCVSAGEALPEAVQIRFRQRFGVDILDGVGSTEALHIFLSNRPNDIRPGTSGKPVPGYQVEVRDSDGRMVPPGMPGDLYVSGGSIALGYWRRADANRKVFQGDWLRTGDIYLIDNDGYYHGLGRADDLLKAGGMWVSPVEVEDRLVAHEAVAEATVVGLPDSAGIDKPVALVVREPGHDHVTADDLIAWCREGLASFKRPRCVEFAEELPRTPTGKLQRFRVKEQLLRNSAKSEVVP